MLAKCREYGMRPVVNNVANTGLDTVSNPNNLDIYLGHEGSLLEMTTDTVDRLFPAGGRAILAKFDYTCLYDGIGIPDTGYPQAYCRAAAGTNMALTRRGPSVGMFVCATIEFSAKIGCRYP